MKLGAAESNNVSGGVARAPGGARWRAVLWLTAVTAIGYGLWYGWQAAHPGPTHYRRGMDDAAAQQFDAAEREWQQGIQEDPKFPGCYEKLGDLYQAGKNYPAAAEKYAAAARLSPHDGTLFFRLAQLQQKLNQLPAAVAAAHQAAALLPNDPEVGSLNADLALKTGDLAGALPLMRHAHTLRPSDPVTLYELVHLELDTQDIAGAERDLTPWLQGRPADAEACYLMGLVAAHKPRTPENIRAELDYALRGATGTQPDPNAPVLLARAYLDAGKLQEALHSYLAIAAAHPNNEEALDGLVTCYRRLARTDQAAKTAGLLKTVVARHEQMNTFKRTLNADPANVEACLKLAHLEEVDGDLPAAEADYVRALRIAPHDETTHMGLAAFYRHIGRNSKADTVEDINYTPDPQ